MCRPPPPLPHHRRGYISRESRKALFLSSFTGGGDGAPPPNIPWRSPLPALARVFAREDPWEDPCFIDDDDEEEVERSSTERAGDAGLDDADAPWDPSLIDDDEELERAGDEGAGDAVSGFRFLCWLVAPLVKNVAAACDCVVVGSGAARVAAPSFCVFASTEILPAIAMTELLVAFVVALIPTESSSATSFAVAALATARAIS